ncbi:glycosyltransferase [Aquariibacter albus]|uniref:Glycosyltransferase n=1 Tax=Aquariibacter albus TaxID=2759899 RepID=A0A839HMS0_9BURK|nr:glycosyltransferase [Aquariibacter albus]MBB1163326.1 glycosyltransferase [Aquariibacter albus]
MKHLFLCREFPPAPYLPGGIGSYVRQMCEALAEAGETVHVIGQRWPGAPRLRELRQGGRLVVHRVALDDPMPAADPFGPRPPAGAVQAAMLASAFPSQVFAWQAALLAEQLVEDEGIDVIEAQEWEAPLACFQLRRAAGLGPTRRPPCIVHLHSSTASIFRANGWDPRVADHDPAVALEAYSIVQADALLAPSQFMADEIEARHGLPPGRVHVIPYPLGPGEPLRREAEAWARPEVLHVGRLEGRKGVHEWAAAVAEVARAEPALRAVFAGGDTPLQATGEGSVRAALRAALPAAVRAQLRFHGNLDAPALQALRARCSLAVVPSRWENFPYSCMEAMASGLPVIVSPGGGMREMVVDGESGWIAAQGSPAGLAEALRRALATPPARRRAMGEAAAQRIRALCHPPAIVARQLAFRAAVVAAAAPPPGALPAGTAVRLHALPGARPRPAAVAAATAMLAAEPALDGVVGWGLDPRSGRIALPRCLDRPHHAAAGGPMPALLLRAEGALARLLPATGGLDAAALAALDAALAAGARLALLPAVLAEAAAPGAPTAPAPPRSAMALAVQRPYRPLLDWLGDCTPAYRAVLLRRALTALLGRRAGRSAPRAVGEGPRPSAAPLPARAPWVPGRVSVLLAAYNAAATLDETLASALAQTHRDLELIAVDDGSTDDTAERLAAWAARDPRVRLLRQRNRGVAAARNRALREACGEFIAPLDADDLWAPAKLERLVARLRAAPAAGLAYSGWVVVDSAGRPLDRSPRWTVAGRALDRLAEVNFAGCASVPVFRHAALRAAPAPLGYDPRLRDLDAQGCEDWDLLLRVAEGHEVAVDPAVLVAYRRHAQSMSASCAAMWRSGCRVLDELAARQPALPQAVLRAGRGQFALHLAGVAFWSGRPREALGWMLRARAPATVLALLPALLRLLLARPGRTAEAATARPLPLAADGVYDETALPAPRLPYARIWQRRWQARAAGSATR